SHHIFEDVAPILKSGDIVFGNLESVISNKGYDPSDFHSVAFRGSPKAADALLSGGFNVVNVANNHVCQHGGAAFLDSVGILDSQGIDVVGCLESNTGKPKPLYKTVNGLKIGFLGYSAVEEAYIPGQKFYSEFQKESVISDIKHIRSDVDILVLSLHFGIEAEDTPTENDIHCVREIVDAGVDIFLGHHPHIFQKVELYNGSVIAYSLGNFLFDLTWDERLRRTAVLQIDVSTDLSISYRLWPVRINAVGLPERAPNITFNFTRGTEKTKLWPPEWLRKLLYLIANFHKGNSYLKAKFIFWKIKCFVRWK
ncbi:CapA family protein, partial [Oleiphilus sp. HI0067]